jgi:hypothetical protein
VLRHTADAVTADSAIATSDEGLAGAFTSDADPPLQLHHPRSCHYVLAADDRLHMAHAKEELKH